MPREGCRRDMTYREEPDLLHVSAILPFLRAGRAPDEVESWLL